MIMPKFVSVCEEPLVQKKGGGTKMEACYFKRLF